MNPKALYNTDRLKPGNSDMDSDKATKKAALDGISFACRNQNRTIFLTIKRENKND